MGEAQIAGHDVVIATCRSGDSAMDACCRVIMAVWGKVSFENAVTGERYETFADVPFALAAQLFVYRSEEDFLYLIWTDGQITIVVQEIDDPKIAAILDGCRSFLRD